MSLNILIVDDIVNNRFVLNRLCQLFEGTSTSEASNGMEAIQYLEEDDSIDLVLLDIEMPIMDGIQAAAIIKERWPDVRVVFQTACYTYQNVDRMSKLGKFIILEKPLSKKDVHEVIEDVMKEKEKEKEKG